MLPYYPPQVRVLTGWFIVCRPYFVLELPKCYFCSVFLNANSDVNVGLLLILPVCFVYQEGLCHIFMVPVLSLLF